MYQDFYLTVFYGKEQVIRTKVIVDSIIKKKSIYRVKTSSIQQIARLVQNYIYYKSKLLSFFKLKFYLTVGDYRKEVKVKMYSDLTFKIFYKDKNIVDTTTLRDIIQENQRSEEIRRAEQQSWDRLRHRTSDIQVVNNSEALKIRQEYDKAIKEHELQNKNKKNKIRKVSF